MDEEGQKYMILSQCSDKYTENRQVCTGSQWRILNSAVALACLDLWRTSWAV